MAPATALCARPATRIKELEDQLDAAVDAATRSFSILEYEYENEADQLLACAPEDTAVHVAADTGAVDHVIAIGALPRGCVPDGIVSGECPSCQVSTLTCVTRLYVPLSLWNSSN